MPGLPEDIRGLDRAVDLQLWMEARQLDTDAADHHHRAAIREARARATTGDEQDDCFAAARLERQMGDLAAKRAAMIRATLL